LVLSACGLPEDDAASPTTATIPEGTTVETTTPTPDDPLAQVIATSIADLAIRLDVEPSGIEIIRSEEITWSDGSLGCPEPGMVYTQALVDGYQVILDHDGRIYLYHAGSDALPFLCPSDEKDGGYDFVPPPRFDT
jgi:hypothetical protein